MPWTAQDEAELQAAEAKVAQLPKAPNPELSLGESAMAGAKKLPGQVYDAAAGVVKAVPGFVVEAAKQAYIGSPFGSDEDRKKRDETIRNVVVNIASGVKNIGLGLGQQAVNQLPENMRHRMFQNMRHHLFPGIKNADTSAAQELEKALYDRYGNWRNIKNTMATAPLAMLSDVATVVPVTAPLKAAKAAKFAAGLAGLGAKGVAGLGVKGVRAASGVVAKASPRAIAAALADPISFQEAQLVDRYEKMGGHLRPGQYSPSNFYRQGDAVVADTPFPGISGFKENHLTRVKPEAQLDEFGRFISNTFGEDEPRITAKVMERADDRIGKVYEDVLPRNTVIMDSDLKSAMDAIDEYVSYSSVAMKEAHVTRITNVMNKIRGLLTDEGLPGKLYQTYRARNGLLDEMAGAKSPVMKDAAQDMREALDDAFARQAKDQDGANLVKARQQSRALRTVKTLADKAPSGRINPGQVLSAVIKEYGDAEKAGQLGVLGQVGAAFLTQMPSSGTAERSVWRSIINAPFSEGIPAVANAAIGLPVSALGTRKVNKIINSTEMRAKLLSRLLSQTP